VRNARISREAEADIDQIAAYTTETWGAAQTDRYLGELEDAFQLLAQSSRIGRSCETIWAGLYRFEVGKHVAFYQVEANGILVVRVLHQQMIPVRAYFEQ
jgi:toxin ParE1/3/4